MRRILLRGSSHPEGTSSASVVSFVKYFVIVLKFTRRFFKEMPKSCIFSDLSPNLQLEEFSIFLKFDVKWNNNNNKSASIFPFINQKTLPIIISDQIIVLCKQDSKLDWKFFSHYLQTFCEWKFFENRPAMYSKDFHTKYLLLNYFRPKYECE